MSLPSDERVQQLLAPVRSAVLDATRTVHSPRRGARHRATRNLILAGAAVAALTAGTIVAVIAGPDYIDHTGTCYEHASLDSRSFPVQGTTDPRTGKLDPLAGCELLWREGSFGPRPVPELVACTLPDASAAIFPREDGPGRDEDFCAALGLAAWDSD
jgi:hypothetical protein